MGDRVTIRVYEQVGVGGQASVHRAEDALGQRIAVKVLKQEYTSDPDFAERFSREIKIMQRLHHPGIVSVMELQLNTGQPAYYMPWAEGTLQSEIDNSPWELTEPRILEAYRSVLDAIEFAHNMNILHRDIKPDNVLFVNGVVKVSDFGLARTMDSFLPPMTRSHVRLGTPGYAAPEVWSGGAKNADVAADVYSLGALLFHLFSKVHPQDGMNINLVPSQYRDLIVRATDTDPARRYSNVTDLISALELRQGGAQHLQVPEEAALGYISSYQWGVTSSARELGDLLCDHSQDGQLYLNVVPKIPGDLIGDLESQAPELLSRVLAAFYRFLDRQHAFVTTDSYAAFLQRVWDCTSDTRIKLSLLKPLLMLGWSHNRYPVRTIFVRVACQAAREPDCVYGLAEILNENPDARAFVKDELLQQPLPTLIVNILNA
jgi:serine/threonine protein kinase